MGSEHLESQTQDKKTLKAIKLKDELLKKCIAVKNPIIPEVESPIEENAILSAMKQIPFFTELFHSLEESGTALSGLASTQATAGQSIQIAAASFQYLGLLGAALNFFRIPAVYLAS